jgi:hypothetical protein
MYKKKFCNGGFPPLRYCPTDVIKKPTKERLYANPISIKELKTDILKYDNDMTVDIEIAEAF